MSQVKISGLIQLTSPLHVASPDKEWFYDRESNYISKSKGGDKSSPVNRTTTTSVVGADGVIEQGIPILPANGLRGRLRRHATAIILDALSRQGERITIDAFHGMTCGAITGKPVKGVFSIKELLAERAHLFLGLFGGGEKVSRSAYLVSDLVPYTELMKDIGAIPQNDTPTPSSVITKKAINSANGREDSLSGVFLMNRLDDVKNGQSEKTMSAIKNYEESAQAWFSEIQKTESVDANGKTKDERAAVSLTNMMNVELVRAGTRFYFNLELFESATPSQAGLMLMSIQQLVEKNQLGGLIAKGCGKFNAKELKIIANGEECDLFSPDGKSLNESCEFIYDSLKAVNDSLNSMTADYINSAFIRTIDETKKAKSDSKEALEIAS